MLGEYRLTETATDHIGLAKAIQDMACKLEYLNKSTPMSRKQVCDGFVVQLIASTFGVSVAVAVQELYVKIEDLPREKEQ